MSGTDSNLPPTSNDDSHPSDEQLFDFDSDVSSHVSECAECAAKMQSARQGLSAVKYYAENSPAIPVETQQRIDAAVSSEWARRERVRRAGSGMPTWRKRLNVAAVFCALAAIMGIAVIGPGGKDAKQNAQPPKRSKQLPETGRQATKDQDLATAKEEAPSGAAGDERAGDAASPAASAVSEGTRDKSKVDGALHVDGVNAQANESATVQTAPPTCYWVDFDNAPKPGGTYTTSKVPLPPTSSPDNSNLDFWPLNRGFVVQCIGSAGSGAEGVGGTP